MATDLIEMSVELAKSHLIQNRMSAKDVPGFIRDIHGTLVSLRAASPTAGADTTASTSMPTLSAPTADQPEKTKAAAPDPAAEPAPSPELSATASGDEGIGDRAISSKVAPIRQEDISSPEFDGLDPWLAKRISPNVARKLDPKNKIHPSVFPNSIICLEDGAKVTLLRAYVRNRFALTPEEYQAKWNLPDDFPMAPPKYIENKRRLAKSSGLGVTTRAHRERKPAATPAAASKTRNTTKSTTAKSATAKKSGATTKAEAASAPKSKAAARASGGRGERRKLSLFQPAAT